MRIVEICSGLFWVRTLAVCAEILSPAICGPRWLCAWAVFWVVTGFLETNECGIYLKYLYDIWTDHVYYRSAFVLFI